jgi:hypothetical protein
LCHNPSAAFGASRRSGAWSSTSRGAA